MKNQTIQPCETKAFQAELDRLCRGHHVQLRVAWAPALVETKVIAVNGRPVPRDYAKYPLVGNDTTPYILGVRFMRDVDGKRIQTGYHKTGGIIVGDVLPTDIAEIDYEQVNYSIHLFVIEQKRRNEYARQVWAKKKQLAFEDIGIDPYGEFPEEGVWDWFADVSEHRGGCCAAAVAAQTRCSGLYREPNGTDLEMVARRLQERARRQRNAHSVAQLAGDIRAGYEAYQRKEVAENLLEAREIHRTAKRALEKPAVYLDPTKEYHGNVND